jgi:hypothetical protein
MFNPEYLRRSLKTLITYANTDQSMAGTVFPEQVSGLAANLNMILVDTVKMNESKEVLCCVDSVLLYGTKLLPRITKCCWT